jgi:hypothetical protein
MGFMSGLLGKVIDSGKRVVSSFSRGREVGHYNPSLFHIFADSTRDYTERVSDVIQKVIGGDVGEMDKTLELVSRDLDVTENKEERRDLMTLETLINLRNEYNEKRIEVEKYNVEVSKRESAREIKYIQFMKNRGHDYDVSRLSRMPKKSLGTFKEYLTKQMEESNLMSNLFRGDGGEKVGEHSGVVGPYITSVGVLHSDSLRKYGIAA